MLYGLVQFCCLWKFPFAYKHQIALKIMLIFNVNVTDPGAEATLYLA